MTPGTYLKKRREAAGLDLRQLAAGLAMLPWAIRPASRADIDRLVGHLENAEADRDNLTIDQAALARNLFAFDLDVYQQLLWRHYDPVARGSPWSLPEPRVCRECACSWHDPCHTRHNGPCAFTERDPGLCTACARRQAAHPSAHNAQRPDRSSAGVEGHEGAPA